MKASELIDYVITLSGTDLPPAQILTMLNIVQDEVSREFRIPISTVTISDVKASTDLSVPADGREEGIIKIYQLTKDADGNVTNSVELPLWDFVTASKYSPNWSAEKPSKNARFVVYDPSQDVNDPYPVPPPDTDKIQHYRMVYAVKPDKMDDLSDEPFTGEYDSFHVMLAYKVAYILSDNDKYFQEFQRLRNALGGASRPPMLFAYNPLMSGLAPSRGGRG